MPTPAIVIIVMITLFIGMLVLVFQAALRQTRRSIANLEDLAQRLGLTVYPQPKKLGFPQLPELRGLRRGKALRVYHYVTGSGKSQSHWAAVETTPRSSTSLTFKLSPQGFGTKVLQVFGVKEIELGDAEFDRRWFVQTNAPDFFRAALIPELRIKLNALLERGGKGEIEKSSGVVRYVERGFFSDAQRCERILAATDLVLDLADVAEVSAQYGARDPAKRK